jgi:hypothetical protein
VQETRLREQPEDAGNRPAPRRGRPGPDSLAWLALVSALFFLAELTPALLKLPLGADEITYIAKTSAHASGVFLPPVHGHGVGLLAAPVTLASTSLTVLRVWMALLSAAALFLSLLCWRGLRPAWVLALAGFIFASLAITQLSGVQVYPDLWAGFGALAITGLLLQAVGRRLRPRVVLPAIAFVAFVVVMMRPQNIVFVLAPTFLAPIVVRGWRQRQVLIAMILGMAAGVLEWVAEAYLWFGGPVTRFRLAGQEPPTFGLHFSLLMQVKTMSGPWYCNPYPGPMPCVPQFYYPAVYIWWVALAVLIGLGLYAVRRLPSRASSWLALITGAWGAILYILLVPFGAPRYFLPTWSLFAILAADGIAWLVTRPVRRPGHRTVAAVAAAVFLLAGAVSQRIVLIGETASAGAVRPFEHQARQLIRLGVKPPCVVPAPSIAYYVGCIGNWSGGTVRQALQHSPGGVKGWHVVRLPARAPFRDILER